MQRELARKAREVGEVGEARKAREVGEVGEVGEARKAREAREVACHFCGQPHPVSAKAGYLANCYVPDVEERLDAALAPASASLMR